MSSKLGVENIAHTNGTNAMTISSGGVVNFTNPPVNVGVSNLQMFRINTNIASTTTPTLITAYTDAHDSSLFKRIGTAWSVSSGVFTPSTSGLYEIMFVADLLSNDEVRYIQFDYRFSTDSGSSYSQHTMYGCMPYLNSTTTYSELNFPRYYNIANPSSFRFHVRFSAHNTSAILRGGASNDISMIMFKRLADSQ